MITRRRGDAEEERLRGEPCRNCGDTTRGAYCPSCGQRKSVLRVSVRTMLADALEDQLVINRALPRTITGLLFRPGFLTDEYIRGRIVRYIAPFRLYLVASVLFFLIASFFGMRALDRTNIGGPTISTNADSARAQLQSRIGSLQIADSAVSAAAAAGGEAAASGSEGTFTRQRLDAARSALAAIPDTATVLDNATIDTIHSRLAGSVATPAGGLQPWARSIEVSAGTNWLDRALERRIRELGHLPPREVFQTIARDMLRYAPHMVFLLLPVFALLLKLLYVRRDRYYAEHFVFALHVHAFVFLTMMLMFALPWALIDLFLIFWVMAYVWLAMKRVYSQGWIRTTLKWSVLGIVYFIAFSFGLAGLTVVTLLLA